MWEFLKHRVQQENPLELRKKGTCSKRIIALEYDWVKYLVNHATQIYVE